MHFGWYMTRHGGKDLELILKPLVKNIHLCEVAPLSMGRRHPEHVGNFLLYPIRHTDGSLVHMVVELSALFFVGSTVIKRGKVINYKRYKGDKR